MIKIVNIASFLKYKHEAVFVEEDSAAGVFVIATLTSVSGIVKEGFLLLTEAMTHGFDFRAR